MKKSLDQIMEDMSALYDEVRQDETELKKASELSNIAGKNLKAYQLQLATDIFTSGRPKQSALPIDQQPTVLSLLTSPH